MGMYFREEMRKQRMQQHQGQQVISQQQQQQDEHKQPHVQSSNSNNINNQPQQLEMKEEEGETVYVVFEGSAKVNPYSSPDYSQCTLLNHSRDTVVIGIFKNENDANARALRQSEDYCMKRKTNPCDPTLPFYQAQDEPYDVYRI